MATEAIDPHRGLAAVVLAAGGGSRFEGSTHKLDAELRGRSVLAWAVDAAVASGIGPVIVVTAAHVTTPLPPSVVVASNDAWATGQQSSLHVGIAAAEQLGAGRVVVGLGDQPFITSAAWRAVAAAGATSPIAVATYRVDDPREGSLDGPVAASPGTAARRRGHPVSLDRSVWPLLPTSGDQGARALMGLRPELVREVPCVGSAADIDTLEDLHRWQSSSSTSSP